MLWTIFVILLIMWLLGLVSSYTFGGFIHLLLVLATLIWGSTFVVVKAALKFASPLVFTTIRMTVATIFLALFFHKSMRRISRPALAKHP